MREEASLSDQMSEENEEATAAEEPQARLSPHCEQLSQSHQDQGHKHHLSLSKQEANDDQTDNIIAENVNSTTSENSLSLTTTDEISKLLVESRPTSNLEANTESSELVATPEPQSNEQLEEKPKDSIKDSESTFDVEMGKQKKKAESFVIDFSGPRNSSEPKKRMSSGNLQKNFEYFQQLRMQQLKQQRKLRKAQKKKKQQERAKPENMWNLRMKFLYELRKYIGVPYAKRYFKPGEPEYESSIFLDCCGLVRRVLWNMQYLFGFRIGQKIDFEIEKTVKMRTCSF